MNAVTALRARLRRACTPGLLFAAALALSPSAQALSVAPLDFATLCQQAQHVLWVRVAARESYVAGGGPVSEAGRDTAPSRTPEQAAGTPDVFPAKTPRAQAVKNARGRPGGLIKTRVKLELLESLKGAADAPGELDVIGGEIDGLRLFVPGLPELELGQSYLLFLRADHARNAMPLVGVNQGYFRFVEQPDGAVQVADAEGRVVAGLDGVSLHLLSPPPRHGERVPVAVLPVADPGGSVSAEEDEDLAPMRAEDFLKALRETLAVQP